MKKNVKKKNKNNMKSTLEKEDAIHYVSESDMINFIDENSDMGWNKICDFIHKVGITNHNESTLWCKSDIIDIRNDPYYNEDQVKWIIDFFEAHPWIEKMMIVFDD